LVCFDFVSLVFETGSHCVAQAGLELVILPSKSLEYCDCGHAPPCLTQKF
jgi:hypothetical protein